MGGLANDADGPDLGFLLLPRDTLGDLQSKSVFFNMTKGKENALEMAEKADLHAVAGVVAEWTIDLTTERPDTLLKQMRTLFGAGRIVSEQESGRFDLKDFKVDLPSTVDPPRSYGGVSGGGLWRVKFADESRSTVVRRVLVGVAFYELPRGDGDMIIRCHGPRSLYNTLVPKIQDVCA